MKIYITNGVTQDGIGSRLQRVVSLMAFACHLRHHMGLNVYYVHTPLWFEGFGQDFSMGESIRGGVTYPENLQPAGTYRKKTRIWEAGIGYIGKTIFDVNHKNYKIGIDSFWRDVSEKKCDGNVYVITHLHTEFDFGLYDINIISNYRDEIRECFKFINETGDAVACHIRRSDATGARLVDDDYYMRVLPKYPNAVIYTQREKFDPSRYVGYTIKYDDEISDILTIAKLSNAGTLIMGNSSLSYVAALLNENRVIYHSMQHIKQKHWIQYE